MTADEGAQVVPPPQNVRLETEIRGIRINWDPPGSGGPFEAYHIYRSVSEGPFEHLAEVEQETLEHVDEGTSLLETYVYYLTAETVSGETDASSSVVRHGWPRCEIIQPDEGQIHVNERCIFPLPVPVGGNVIG